MNTPETNNLNRHLDDHSPYPKNETPLASGEPSKQPKKSPLRYLIPAIIFLVVLAYIVTQIEKDNSLPTSTPPFSFMPELAAKSILEESGQMDESASSDWWLNSGGLMVIEKGTFSTNKGRLVGDSYWRKLYKQSSAQDTENGYQPQNLFRLVTQKRWKNFEQTVYFNIDTINLSDSENRNESNGVLLFNRYQDGDNLYYAGLRVDGHAVIKKKIKGKYFTMAERQIFGEEDAYDQESYPNLLSTHNWIGLRSKVATIDQRTVLIQLYVDQKQNGEWTLVLETKDKNNVYGGPPFFHDGHAGIRSDFMDVSFKEYSIHELPTIEE